MLLVAPALQQWLGGQEVQADQLVRAWSGDPDVDIAFVPVNPALANPLDWIERIPYVRTAARIPVRLVAMCRAMLRAQLVHVFAASHSSFVIATLPAWCAAKLLGKPILIHYHSSRGIEHVRSSRLARSVLLRSDAVAVPSGYLAETFGAQGIATHVIPNVVEASQFPFRFRNPVRPVLLCPRNFEPRCGVDLVLRAFAEVKSKLPSARLLLVGRGSQEHALRALARNLGLSDVEFCGAVSRDQIGEYFSRADLFVNASRLDNMPVSILEAFASGLPVATTAAGGIPWMVEHERTGLLSEPGDFHSLGLNIIRLLKNYELAARLADCAHREVARCEWQSVRPLWLAVYQSLVSR